MDDLTAILERMPDDCYLQISKTEIMKTSHYSASITYRGRSLAWADNLVTDPSHIVPMLTQHLNMTIKESLEKMFEREGEK